MKDFKVFRVEGEIYRGPIPTDWQKLLRIGIRKTVTLQSGFNDYMVDGKLYTLDEEAAQFGINVVHFPLSGIIPSSFKRLLQIATYIDACERDREAIYVHCLHGHDRTGLVIATYRIIFQNWTIDAAVQEMLSYGFNAKVYAIWLWLFKRRMAKELKKRELVKSLVA